MNLSILLPYLLQGAAFGFTAAAAPGVYQTFLINQTLSGGWRRGTAVAFGPLLSDPPIVIGILFILDKLPGSFITIIKLVGGLFALFMAWSLYKAYKSPKTPDKNQGAENTDNIQPASAWGSLTRGALMNLLSPGPYTFWATVLGPLLLEAMQQSSASGSALLLGFYGTFIGSLLGLVGLFHQAKRLGERLVRYLILASILILGIFGVLLIISGL